MPPAATTSAQALSNLQSFEGSQPSASTVASNNANQFGVPQQQQQVSGLQAAIQNTTNLLNQVAPTVMGNTQNSLVTQAQANSQIANQEAPIQTNLTNEGNQYSAANTALTNDQNSANALTTADLTGQQNQLSYLQSIYSDLANAQQQAFNNNEQLKTDAAGSTSSGSSGTSSPSLASLLGGSSSGSSSGGGGGTMSRNSVGGYEFTGANGQPESMAAYFAGEGYSGQALSTAAANLLKASGSANDRGIGNAIASGHYTPAELESLYPQVFGGNY